MRLMRRPRTPLETLCGLRHWQSTVGGSSMCPCVARGARGRPGGHIRASRTAGRRGLPAFEACAGRREINKQTYGCPYS